MSVIPTGIVFPSELQEMVNRVMEGSLKSERTSEQIKYIRGWILDATQKRYADFIQRHGIPSEPLVLKLVCEVAILRAVNEWSQALGHGLAVPSMGDL